MTHGCVFGGPSPRARIPTARSRFTLASISPSNLVTRFRRRDTDAAAACGRPAGRKGGHVGGKFARGLGFARIMLA